MTIELKHAYPDHLDRNELKVIDCLIRDALALGCTISVHDGEEWPVKKSRDYEHITSAVAATEHTKIRVRDDEQPDLWADFLFVHGNLPSEVLADMHDSPWARSIAVGMEACANKLEALGH